MPSTMNFFATASLFTCLGVAVTTATLQDKPDTKAPEPTTSMELGNFSVSLSVKDLKASRAFYEKLGFKTFHDQSKYNYVIMQNETATIGLFQGMFEGNILTFNPGWDRSAQDLKEFTDVRELQKRIKAAGIKPVTEADESSTDVASFVLQDPDGNSILIDQHRPAPPK